MNAMTDDNFSGKNGQALHVFTTMSNNASIDLLGRLGLSGKYVPLMILHDGRILEKSKDICQYAIEQGMAK
jgi:glutaredoxin 2